MSTTNNESTFPGLWITSQQEAIWQANAKVHIDRLMGVTGILMLTHMVARLLVSILGRRSNLSKEQKEKAPSLILGAAHALFCVFSGVSMAWGPDSPPHQQLNLLGFSEKHGFVSTINIGFWLSSSFFTVTKVSSFGRRAAAIVTGKTGLLAIMTYFDAMYPCLLGVKVWQWWNLTELGLLAVIGVKFVIGSKIGAKIKVGTMMLGMAVSLVCVWLSGYLVMWLHWWMSANEVYDLPGEFPQREFVKTYFAAKMGAAIAWTFLSYLNFKEALSITKEWSEAMKAAKSSQSALKQDETKKTS